MTITSEIIKSILEENNYSQEKLAKILNVSQKAISNWINGVDTPKASSMLLIYKKFKITPNQLLGIDPYYDSPKTTSNNDNKTYNDIHHNNIVNIDQRKEK